MKALSRHDWLQYAFSITALLFSALALMVAVMELRAAREQLDADVWPYVGIDMTISNDSAVIRLENKGLGPAVLRQVRVFLPDESGEYARVTDMTRLGPEGWQTRSDVLFDSSDLAGDVLAVDDSEVIASFAGPNIGLQSLQTFFDARVEVCYCSITGTCWREFSRNIEGPQAVDQCEPERNDITETMRSVFQPGADNAETEE